MLWKLLVEYLRPHRKLLAAVVVFQLAQSIASLYLPTLNADIIDEGVAKGNVGYILSLGGVILAITLLQIVCAVIAVYFAAKAAMGVGRGPQGSDLRKGGGVLRAGSHQVRRAKPHHKVHQRRPAGPAVGADVRHHAGHRAHAQHRRCDHGGAAGRAAVLADRRFASDTLALNPPAVPAREHEIERRTPSKEPHRPTSPPGATMPLLPAFLKGL